TVGAEVVILAVDGDDGRAPGLVKSVNGWTVGTRHGTTPRFPKRYVYRFSEPLCRTIPRRCVRLTRVRLWVSAKSGRPDSNRRRPAWECGSSRIRNCSKLFSCNQFRPGRVPDFLRACAAACAGPEQPLGQNAHRP